MAIAPSKLGQLIDQEWKSDEQVVRCLRKANLVRPEASDEQLIEALRRAREEHLSYPEVGRMFNSPNERARCYLEPYLSDKGKSWAVPLESLKLPDDPSTTESQDEATLTRTILPDPEGKPEMKSRVYLVIACRVIGLGVTVATAYYIMNQMAGTIEAR